MMDFIIKYRTLAEFCYFLSWPVTLLAALAVIYQIIEFRKEAKTRFTRETISTTLEILDRKIKSIEALCHEAFSKRGVITHPKDSLKISGFCYDKVICDPEWMEWYSSDEAVHFRNDIITILNEFETLANYIYSGIVDEDICYDLESYYVLSVFEDLIIFIALNIEEENSRLYTNLVKLYLNWTQRVALDKTTKNHEELSQALASMPKPKPHKILK